MVAAAVRAAAIFILSLSASAQTVHVYIGGITATSVILAWGTATGGHGENTIGRNSAPMGAARIRFGDQTLTITDRNWLEARNLQPDTAYEYEVEINGKKAGGGTVHTYPHHATRLAFFVIGDYGTGAGAQQAIAAAMANEFHKRAGTDNPVRFVLTVGDNIYADANLGYLTSHSGSEDRDWETKFFRPYAELLREIPFYPTLGNHDGNASESRGDLSTYLDNFFFPGNRPARWYHCDYADLAEFFALDSTDNTTSGHTTPAYAPDGEQSRWLAEVLAASKAPWKIPYFHHPPFNAGPGHGASYNVLRHWVDLFAKSGVKVVFTGHEHNFQISEDSDITGHVRYIVSGAGGELRPANVLASMARAHIEGWSPQHHFLLVEIDGRIMHITALSNDRMLIRDAAGREVTQPFTISLP